MTDVALAFLPKPLSIALVRILPSHALPAGFQQTRKFKQICASIAEIGMIEPLSISPVDRKSGQHCLLDGHLRWEALRTLDYEEAPCLVATSDETYTYNNYVNRLSTVQEHLMIRRAVERGVSPERLARSLCVDVRQITKKMTMLDGICPEVVALMKDRQFSTEVSSALRQMKPVRQIECMQLMVSANNTTISYAQAMLAATSPAMLVQGKRPARRAGASQEQVVRMEREMSNLQDRYRLAENTYGEDVLHLVLARGFIVKLLGNAQVHRYLEKHDATVLEQFEEIVRMASMEL
ncbi:plasmid partitioning protein RepB C-terminal domain-containing protein [Variovorax rhizosphaerae]|uniref:Plasmid partitioning protein RepB C-terminal domain-containing protein n=1 Tax=Variovorax rhizosphaerae TaxID=1836200 RepID=A0ABU8X134_9BURK